MLNFVESPGNHRSLLFKISTLSLLGKSRYKICCPMSRRSVTTQADSVKHYDEMLGQGNRAAPPSWIQLSTVLGTIYKQLKLGAVIQDPITLELICTMCALIVDDTNPYTWREHILDPGELWWQTQIELKQCSHLLNAMGGALKAEKCFWYLLDYMCIDRKWTYADACSRISQSQTLITKSPIKQEEVTESKKTIGIYDSPSGGNEGYLSYIINKAAQRVNRMKNDHLQSHVA
jgi:hypothetical protein